jgi:Ca2+-binding EF-hand superfamily protein
MNAKKLEPKSRYAEYDTDGDGIVSDEELARHQEMLQLELQEEKADSQRKMAWVL